MKADRHATAPFYGALTTAPLPLPAAPILTGVRQDRASFDPPRLAISRLAARLELPAPAALAALRRYSTVSRRTSSTVVTPALIFSRPLMRSVNIPSSSAFFFSSTAVAPTMIRSRIPSLISITS